VADSAQNPGSAMHALAWRPTRGLEWGLGRDLPLSMMSVSVLL
jgi:hypothetical protein